MRFVLSAAMTICLLVGSTSSGSASAPDPGAVGPYSVGHIGFVLVDASRDAGSVYGGRPIYVSLFYPADRSGITSASPEARYPLDPVAGRWPMSASSNWERYGLDRAYDALPVSRDKPFPLVMYSPGWTNPYFFGLFAGTRIASHGFVVALLTHHADGAYPWDPWPAIHVALMNRPRDVSYALSAVIAMGADPAGPLSGAVRADQVAALGHSLGGYAALVLAGGDDLVCDRPAMEPRGLPIPPETCVASRPDPRIKAIATFDGSSQILWFREMGRITVPAMVIGQEWENVGSWHARAHAAIAAEPNYRVDVNNAMHPSFTTFCENARVLGDVGALTPTQVANRLRQPWCTTALSSLEVQRLASKYAVTFFKKNLAGDSGYQHILTPGWALTSERNIEFFATEKTNAKVTFEHLPCLTGSCPAFRYFPNQPGSARERAHELAEQDPSDATGAGLDP